MLYDERKKRQIIMEHYRNPVTANPNLKAQDLETLYSTSCADVLKIKKTWKDDVLVKVETQMQGCAIFKASADLFAQLIEGKKRQEINQLKSYYLAFLNGDQKHLEKLERLTVFANVKKQLSRLQCAALITQAFEEL